MTEQYRVAFDASGSHASVHAYALSALPHYYPDAAKVIRVAVTARTPASRQAFAARNGFAEALTPEDFWKRRDIDAMVLLSPNASHYPHLRKALEMRVRRIYVEKPICVTQQEEAELAELLRKLPKDTVIQTGFQFLQMAAVRRALRWWCKDGLGGKPVHFHVRYLHSGYLEPSYRQARGWRLKPAPEGGALADLGSHAFSLLVAFLGEGLDVVAARQSGVFEDVPAESDLCTTVLLHDKTSGAAGTLIASRISAGAGDELALELRGTQGALRFSTNQPDVLQTCRTDQQGRWETVYCGSDYRPVTHFPAPHASAGWLRPLVHAQYLFFGGIDDEAPLIPDGWHALLVQRLVHHTVDALQATRSGNGNEA